MKKIELKGELEEIVVETKRCSKVVKGGKRLSFSALVIVGDKQGLVGYGYGKANEGHFAIEKAIKEAKKNLTIVPRKDTTIPHTIFAEMGATKVLIRPACKGTGLIAGPAVRAVLELAGVSDILTKVYGSTNPVNVVKATFKAIALLKTKKMVENLRGIRII